MKKIILFLVMGILALSACTQKMESDASNMSVNGGGESIVVPGGTETTKMNLGVLFSSPTKAAGDWEGVLQITGNGIDGTYTTLINRKRLDNGGFLTIILPLGVKHFEVSVNYDSGSAIHNYAGSADATINSGTNNVAIVLTKQNPGVTLIDVTIRERISISLREQGSSFPVANVAVTFRRGNDVVGTVNTDADGQAIIDLPVQATNESAYTYMADLYQYVRVNGTIKVMLGKINLNGTETSVMHLSHNLLFDNVQPEIGGFEIYQTDNNAISPFGPNQVVAQAPNGYFYVRFNVSDANNIRSLTSNIGTIEYLGGTTYRVILPQLPEGQHSFSVTVIDNAGNQRITTYIITSFIFAISV